MPQPTNDPNRAGFPTSNGTHNPSGGGRGNNAPKK